MKNSRQTKRALFSSVMALVLCFTMLLGTTFAWFTDSVSSVNNVIKAGNLDVELYYEDATGTYVKVDPAQSLFDGTLWEPGHVEVVNMKVVNEGTLALKYQLQVNAVSEITSETKDGKEIRLSEHIKYAVLDEVVAGRDDAVNKAAANATTLNQATTVNGQMLPKTAQTYEDDIVTLVVWMPETVGNEANYATGKVAPEITLGIDLVATQLVNESDSFGPDYDNGADYIEAWDGISATPADELTQDANGVYQIGSAADLAGFRDLVNNGAVVPFALASTTTAGDTTANAVLTADINLGGHVWTPIGDVMGSSYQGTFDGQGHTISNLSVTVTEAEGVGAGLFGFVKAGTIKNLTVKNVSITGQEWAGGLVGYAICADIDDCSVIGGTVTGTTKVGAVAGYFSGNLTDSVVENVVVTGEAKVGGLAGRVNGNDDPSVVKGNTVRNSFVYSTDDTDDADAAAIVSQILGESNVTIANNKEENVVTNERTEMEFVAEGVAKVEIPEGVGKVIKAYEVYSAEGVANIPTVIAENAHSEDRKLYFELMSDVDMTGKVWNPISLHWVDFEGNGYTISNLNCAQAAYGKSGFASYLGAGSIKNLTLENVTAAGTQAGVFAGSVESGKIENCYLKGDNTVTWQQNTTSDYVETWNGIGAICGVNQSGTMNVEIVEGATVTLDKTGMTTAEGCVFIDNLTGYITPNKGAVTNNGTIIIATKVAITEESTANDFNEALAAGNTVVLEEDFANEGVVASSSYGKTGIKQTNGGTIDGNGNTLTVTGANGTWDSAIYSSGGTIKNLTVKGAFRGILVGDSLSEDLIIDNVVIDDVCYTFHADGTPAQANEYKVIVTNSIINGWTSYSANLSSIEFTNCQFGEGTGGYKYAYMRPYAPTVLENCVFEVGFELDATCSDSIVITNCYVGETLITADNITTLLGADAANATVK